MFHDNRNIRLRRQRIKWKPYFRIRPPYDLDEIPSAIESLRADPALREHYRQQSRRRSEAFTADEIMRQWQSVILDGTQQEE